MITSKPLCDSHTCTREGCSPEAGCQGHVAREWAPKGFEQQAKRLVEEMDKWGLILTVEQRPLTPLAMSHYETVVTVQPKFIRGVTPV